MAVFEPPVGEQATVCALVLGIEQGPYSSGEHADKQAAKPIRIPRLRSTLIFDILNTPTFTDAKRQIRNSENVYHFMGGTASAKEKCRIVSHAESFLQNKDPWVTLCVFTLGF